MAAGPRAALALLPLLLAAGGARANDSTAEIGTGGLVLTRSDGIAMLREDLAIAPDRISIRSVFRNLTGADIATDVAFPLPDIDFRRFPMVDLAIPHPRDDNFVGFATRIDGAPVALAIRQSASVRGEDVTADLAAAGIPLAGWRAAEAIARLPRPRRAELLRRGILSDQTGEAVPAWTLRTAFLRRQTFPVGREVVVEHRYRPSVGTSADTALRRRNRGNDFQLAEDRKTYCLEPGFLAEVGRIADRAGPDHALPERRIRYVLASGANWARPIGDFRLTVETGGAGVLLASCLPGLRETAPGRFGLRRADYIPDRDIAILLVGRPAKTSRDARPRRPGTPGTPKRRARGAAGDMTGRRP